MFFLKLFIFFVIAFFVSTVDAKPFNVYRVMNDKVVDVPVDTDVRQAPSLPKTLIVRSGYYQFMGKVFYLKEAGLYRFMTKGINTEQRIVHDGDVKKLLSSIAWIASQGSTDNTLSLERLEKEALTRNISVTCGLNVRFAEYLLKNLGINARSVATFTLDTWDGYDDGHFMLEVFLPDVKKWVLYDMVAKAYFERHGQMLSLIELYYYAKTSDFDIKPISNTTKIDLATFSAYSFFMDGILNNPKPWYAHIMHILMMGNDYFCVDTPENRANFESHFPGSTYLTDSQFRQKYY